MINTIDLLMVEIKRMRELSVKMHEQGFVERGKYRRQEANRLQKILDILKTEYAIMNLERMAIKLMSLNMTNKAYRAEVKSLRIRLVELEKQFEGEKSEIYNKDTG